MKGKVVFLPWRDINTFSCRLRCYQNAEGLRKLGWECQIGTDNAENADFVIFQKRYSASDLALAKRCKGKIILDICDPNWLIGQKKNMQMMAEVADYITTSSAKLSQWFQKRGRKAQAIPEGFDFNAIPKIQKEDKLTIVWHGSRSNTKYLIMLIEPLNRLSQKLDFNFRIIVDKPFSIPRFNFKPQITEWGLETHLGEIAKCHIGIAPLGSDEWCSYKSINKPVSYMALGLPVVCSSIPSYEEIIVNGKNGFIVKDNDPQKWYEAIKILITNEEKRTSFIQQGKKIAQAFSLENIAQRWDSLFRELCHA